VQIIAYVDVVLIARTCRDMIEGFRSLESVATRFGLKINQNKTKFMAMNTRRLLDKHILEKEPYNFEHVHNFTYLGTVSTKDNNITGEVQNRIAIANRCYFSLHKRIKSNFVSRTPKILLYKTYNSFVPDSAGRYPEWLRRRWMYSNGKYFEEYMALLRAVISGGVDIMKNSVIFLKSPDSQ
jgi:hypothetical protein